MQKLDLFLFSVDELLPKFNEDVVIFCQIKAPKTAQYIKNPSFPNEKGVWVTYSYAGYAVVIEDIVTHWCYLPYLT
jgi:hypothetical protein